MKKHILLITDSYPPEIRSASHLMLELAQELTRRDFQVTVITGWPQYNLASDLQQMMTEDITESGVRVIRIKHLPHHCVHFVIRGISQLILPYLFIRKIKKYVTTKIDAVIVYSPPLPLAFVGKWIQKKYHAKFILNVQDLFPQNAIDLDILRNKWLIKFFFWMEKISYYNADIIAVHSEGNKTQLAAHYSDIKRKFTVMHNWVDVDAHQATQSNQNFRDLFNLHDKFVFVFAGIVGPSQHLSALIAVAEKLQHIPDICFLIVGDGADKEKLQTMVAQLNLQNVLFKPFINRAVYPNLLKACNVGFVSLSAKNKTPVVPGKILGYMAAGLPVLAFLHQESDGHTIIEAAQCGYAVVSDDITRLVAVITQMYQQKERCAALGESGLCYAKTHFSKETCVDRIIDFF